MNYMDYCIVSVLDTVSETSMPLNEFVIYRINKYPEIKQYIIVCDTPEHTHLSLPIRLGVIYIDRDITKIKAAMKTIVDECPKQRIIVHLHQIKSALLFYKAMLFEKKTYRTLFTVHSAYALRNIKYKASSMLLALLSNCTTCVSQSSYKTYSPIAKLIKGNKISPIQNGVDLERIDSVLGSGVYEKISDVRTIVYVGRLIPIKNQKFLMDLFGSLKECRLIFVGAEGDNKEISMHIKSNHLSDKITITGLIPRDKVFEILRTADIYVSSSTVEGLPVSVLEAMYVGLPVILSDIEAHRELAEKIDGIMLLSLNDKKIWVNTINAYLSLDKAELVKIGNKCREGVAEHFSLMAMHKQYDEVYKNLLV